MATLHFALAQVVKANAKHAGDQLQLGQRFRVFALANVGSDRFGTMRETLEETGVDLLRGGVPIGRLDDVEPSSPRLPKMRIAPYVFAVPEETEARVASHELHSVHWIPLDLLASPEMVFDAVHLPHALSPVIV